ncbi:MAG: ParB/Srx family N-terminal domain-containing protein [Natronincolaceae bacterium]
MKVQKIDIDKLKPHPKNPRVHPDSAIEKLVRSIKEFGWTNPILVSKDGQILAGHARLKAAKKAGIEEVPVIYLPLEGAKAEAYMIADNRLQEETDWDYEKLESLLGNMTESGFDLEITGFSEIEVEGLLQDVDIDNFLIDVNEPKEAENKKPITCPNCGYEII